MSGRAVSRVALINVLGWPLVAAAIALAAATLARGGSATPTCTAYSTTITCDAPPCTHAYIGPTQRWCETVAEGGDSWCCTGECFMFRCDPPTSGCGGNYGYKYAYISGPTKHQACPVTIAQCGFVANDYDCYSVATNVSLQEATRGPAGAR